MEQLQATNEGTCGTSDLTDELGGLVQKSLRTIDLRLMADLMDEASDILAKIPVDVFDAMQIRCYLADELCGSAIMLRDEAALREKTPNVEKGQQHESNTASRTATVPDDGERTEQQRSIERHVRVERRVGGAFALPILREG